MPKLHYPFTSSAEFPRRPSLVDAAIYEGGKRAVSPGSLDEAFTALDQHPNGFAWLGLYRPTHEELIALGEEFSLHLLAIEDAVERHQRPKLERYGETVFIVLRPSAWNPAAQEVEFGELHLFVGPNFVITIRHSETPDLSQVRHRMEAGHLLRFGTPTVLYGVLDAVVDNWAPMLDELEDIVNVIEEEIFAGKPAISRRIYNLSRQVIDLERSIQPLVSIMARLQSQFEMQKVDKEVRRHLRDVADHIKHALDRTTRLRSLLREVLSMNATMVAERQNEEMTRLTEQTVQQNEQVKRISSWAAIFFLPTLIAGIYGMNFERMPELGWAFGYPFALFLMVAGSAALWAVFKKIDWL